MANWFELLEDWFELCGGDIWIAIVNAGNQKEIQIYHNILVWMLGPGKLNKHCSYLNPADFGDM